MNTDAPWPDLTEAGQRVLKIQTKLHQWASDDAGRVFADLFNLVTDPAFLMVAWDRVRGNQGARSAGVDGIVCSGAEVAAAKKAWPHGFFVVPGVRPANGAIGDQKRVVTPRAALDAGASILVVGRPITQAQDPDMAAREIEATL